MCALWNPVKQVTEEDNFISTFSLSLDLSVHLSNGAVQKLQWASQDSQSHRSHLKQFNQVTVMSSQQWLRSKVIHFTRLLWFVRNINQEEDTLQFYEPQTISSLRLFNGVTLSQSEERPEPIRKEVILSEWSMKIWDISGERSENLNPAGWVV